MKFIYTTLALLFTLSLVGQDAVLFKPEFKENSTYLSTLDMGTLSSSVQVKDSVSTDMPALNTTMKMILSQVTSEQGADGSIPMIMKYDSIVISSEGVPQGMGDTEDLLEGVRVYAHINNGYKIVIDSITGAESDPVMMQTMGQTMEQFTGAVEFPEEKMKIGESFEQDLSKTSSISAQMPGSTMIMKYTLDSIKDDTAFFTTSITMAGQMGEMMTMTGSGDGTMTFDLINNYVNTSDMTMTMIMDMTMGDEGMHMEMTMDQKMKIELVE